MPVCACGCVMHTKDLASLRNGEWDSIITTSPAFFATHGSPLTRCLTDNQASAWLMRGGGGGVGDFRPKESCFLKNVPSAL